KGDYDWFYEGFTMYEAARIAVRLNLLTFQEFLNAIARAYDAYLKDAAGGRWSLVDASKRRWTGGSSSVYAKSMILALLLDLKMRSASRDKKGIDQIYQKLFADHRLSGNQSQEMADGNEATLNLLKSNPATSSSLSLITEPTPIDLQSQLAPYGLTV